MFYINVKLLALKNNHLNTINTELVDNYGWSLKKEYIKEPQEKYYVDDSNRERFSIVVVGGADSTVDMLTKWKNC